LQNQKQSILSFLTCWLGSGEDKLSSAASLHLPVARVDVDAVNREGLQPGDLQLTLRHRLLHKVKLAVGWLQVGGAAVTSSLERRDSAAIGVQAVGVSGVGNTKKISAPPIWWPTSENDRDKDECKGKRGRLTFTKV